MTEQEQQYKNEFHGLISLLDLDYKDIAEITGHTYKSITSMLAPSKPLPRWCKLIVRLYKSESLKQHMLTNVNLDHLIQKTESRIEMLYGEKTESSKVELKSAHQVLIDLHLIRP